MGETKGLFVISGRNRAVVDADVDVLIVITEIFTEDGQTADMVSVVVDCHFKSDGTFVCQIQMVDRNIGNLKTINERSAFVDN